MPILSRAHVHVLQPRLCSHSHGSLWNPGGLDSRVACSVQTHSEHQDTGECACSLRKSLERRRAEASLPRTRPCRDHGRSGALQVSDGGLWRPPLLRSLADGVELAAWLKSAQSTDVQLGGAHSSAQAVMLDQPRSSRWGSLSLALCPADGCLAFRRERCTLHAPGSGQRLHRAQSPRRHDSGRGAEERGTAPLICLLTSCLVTTQRAAPAVPRAAHVPAAGVTVRVLRAADHFAILGYPLYPFARVAERLRRLLRVGTQRRPPPKDAGAGVQLMRSYAVFCERAADAGSGGYVIIAASPPSLGSYH